MKRLIDGIITHEMDCKQWHVTVNGSLRYILYIPEVIAKQSTQCRQTVQRANPCITPVQNTHGA